MIAISTIKRMSLTLIFRMRTTTPLNNSFRNRQTSKQQTDNHAKFSQGKKKRFYFDSGNRYFVHRVLLNIPYRKVKKNIIFYLSFVALFVTGYIFGSLSNLETNNETHFTPDNLNHSLLQDNFIFYLAIVIFSSPKTFERRQVIRKTWLLTKENNNIKHYFAIGVKSLNNEQLISLKEEHKSFDDLLLLHSFSDSYSRLSEKLLEIFKWLDKNIQYKFFLKVDDDSFVRIEALSHALAKLPLEKLYYGFFDGQAKVKTRGKWKEKNWFLCDRYLPYAKGGGYVLSQDLVHLIASLSNYLTLYQNEDVSLGAWLAPFNIKRVHEQNFDTECPSRGCLNSYLITHKQSVSMMEQKYKSLHDSGHLCSLEHKVRNSYEYNWNVPPSRCCLRDENEP